MANDTLKPLGRMMSDLVNDPVVISYHLWGWLNTNLTDDAWDIFDGADMEDGFEVWRLLNVDVTQKTLAGRLGLEDVVLTPLGYKTSLRYLKPWYAGTRPTRNMSTLEE